jgi:type II secretion system protein C
MDEKRFIRLMWALKALLAVVLVYVGFTALTTHLHVGTIINNPEAASGDEQDANEQAAPLPTGSPADYSAIVQRNLFSGHGMMPPTSGRRSQVLDSLPSAEELGLKLVGAIAGGPAASRAIIQNTRNNTINPYRIGEVVAAATIESIQRDAVLLRHQGRQLILRLHTTTSRSNAGKEEKAASAEIAVVKGATPPLSTQAGYLEEVFRKVRIEPSVKNNRTQGLRISGLEKVPMAEMFGFKNGDVIQSINGQQLTSKQKAFQVLMKARTQSKVDIQMLRDGKSKDLSFEI